MTSHNLGMWEHYCEEEKDVLGMEVGCPCDWCEKTQSDCEQEKVRSE